MVVAKIPWLGSSFVGFICGIWIQNDFHKFTTYNRSKMTKLHVDNQKVILQLENPKTQLQIEAIRDTSTELASPIRGFMDGRIEESMTSILNISLTDKRNGKVIFEGSGQNAGLEVAGKIEELIP